MAPPRNKNRAVFADCVCLWLRRGRGPALAPGHEEDLEDDARFEWLSPDERTRRPFQRSRAAALRLAARWDLCCSGDGLHHLHQIGADAAYVPLTQVPLLPACCRSQKSLLAPGGILRLAIHSCLPCAVPVLMWAAWAGLLAAAGLLSLVQVGHACASWRSMLFEITSCRSGGTTEKRDLA
jgi:hypothetical protein